MRMIRIPTLPECLGWPATGGGTLPAVRFVDLALAPFVGVTRELGVGVFQLCEQLLPVWVVLREMVDLPFHRPSQTADFAIDTVCRVLVKPRERVGCEPVLEAL
jgi:hypothetical protein